MKKMICIVILLAYLVSSIPAIIVSADSNSGLTIEEMMEKFPHGKYWNGGNADGWTDIPCTHHGSCPNYGGCGCNSFLGLSIQCMGFAEKLGYDATNSNPRNNANGWYTYENASALNALKPGDIVRFYTSNGKSMHSIYVTAVDGDAVTYADCNSGSKKDCNIRWGATTTKSYLSSVFIHLRSAPFAVEESRTHEYIRDCGAPYASSGTVRVINSTTFKSLPCSKETSADSIDIHTPSKGSEWTVTAIYQNTAGNYWYKTSYNGQDCYLYSGDAEFISADWGEITISGVAAPTSLELGEGFPIKGYISSSKLPLSFVEAYVLSGGSVATKSEASPAEDAKTFEIYRSAVDMNLKFGSLALGTYTYQIVVTPLNYKADGNSLTSLTPRTFILHESKFTVGSASSCSHSYSSEITVQGNCVEPSIWTYTCTLCGDSYTETIPAIGMHSYSAWETIDSATCTDQGTQQRICVTCGDIQSETIAAIGHNYTATKIPATCITYEKIRHVCVECGHTYEEDVDVSYSEWSETRPSGVSEDRIESKVEYRYSILEKAMSSQPVINGIAGTPFWQQTGNEMLDYVKSWPEGFSRDHSLYSLYNNEIPVSSESETSKSVADFEEVKGYLYFHWCRGTYNDGPINRRVNSYYDGEFVAFHAFFSTTAPSSLSPSPEADGSYVHSNADCCKDSYWYFTVPVYTCQYSTFEKMYHHEQWSDWTSWGDQILSASDDVKEETRIVYRYAIQELADHNWSEWLIQQEATCTQEGRLERKCDVCDSVETIYRSTIEHNWENDICTMCNQQRVANASDFTWIINEKNELTITGYTGTAVNLLIPQTIDGYNVTIIGDYAFDHCSNIETVTLPAGVTAIGDYAFYDCKKLEKIGIPNTVLQIGDGAFLDCASLTGILIPDSVQEIGISAFIRCNALNTVVLGSGLSAINGYLFYDCTGLSSIRIPDNISAIGDCAFGNCSSLTDVVFEGSAPDISTSAFENVSVVAKYSLNKDGWVTEKIQNYGGDITWVANEALGVANWSVALESAIAVKFHLFIDDELANTALVRVTFGTNVVTYAVNDLLPIGNEKYSITVETAASQMTESIIIQIINNGEVIDVSAYSVQQYCNFILNNDAYYYYQSMARELLNYGAMAQIYFDYGTEKLANEGITGTTVTEVPDDTEKLILRGNIEGLRFYGASLVYRDRIAVRYYFTGDVSGLKFVANGNTYTPTTKDGMHYVEVADILPQNLDQQITLTITDADGNTQTVTYGPMNYIVRMIEKGSDDLKNLLKALYNYHLTAKSLQTTV